MNPRLREILRTAREGVRGLAWLTHLGLAVRCSCCGSRFRGFLPYDGVNPPIADVECPRCRSHHRHRLLALYFGGHPELFTPRTGSFRLLHLAPEATLEMELAAPGRVVVRSGFSPEHCGGGVAADLEALPFADGAFDAVVGVHVLEHVGDDGRAMREIRRVLAPGAWAVLQVPLDPNRADTDEDPEVTDPGERERRFGQHDHVRLYGRDYASRLDAAGFTVEIDPFVRTFDEASRRRLGLDEEEDVYLCRRRA